MARSKWLATFTTSVLAFLASATLAGAQEMPPKYAAVLEALGKKGDFKDGVLKVNIPRTDLRSRSASDRRLPRSASAAGSR